MKDKWNNKSNLVENCDNDQELQLVVVRSNMESFFFSNYWIIIPIIYLVRVLIQYIDLRLIPNALFDFVKISSEIALIIAFTFSRVFFFEIKNRIYRFLNNKIISNKCHSESNNSTLNNKFIARFDFFLNHPLRMISGLVASIIVLLYYSLRIGGLGALFKDAGLSLTYIDLLLYIFPSVAYAYFAGVLAWKLFTTSYILQNIPKIFKINVRAGHPDGAGGLLPIGILCLNMVYVTVVPTVISAFIITVPIWAPSSFLPYIMANKVALFGFSPMILFVGLIGSVFGLLPLFKFHPVMLQHKLDMGETLSKISEKIIELKMNTVEISEGKKMGSIDDKIKEINFLQGIYETYNKTSSWPVNKQVLFGIWGTQSFLFGQIALFLNLIKQFSK